MTRWREGLCLVSAGCLLLVGLLVWLGEMPVLTALAWGWAVFVLFGVGLLGESSLHWQRRVPLGALLGVSVPLAFGLTLWWWLALAAALGALLAWLGIEWLELLAFWT